MSISTNFSVTGWWLWYNVLIYFTDRPTKKIITDEPFILLSPTKRPICTSRRQVSSACGIPTYATTCTENINGPVINYREGGGGGTKREGGVK